MRWLAYVNTRYPGKSDKIETRRAQFSLPGTTKADVYAAAQYAAKTYKVKEDTILCMPCCTPHCMNDDTHSEECEKRFNERMAPYITEL